MKCSRKHEIFRVFPATLNVISQKSDFLWDSAEYLHRAPCWVDDVQGINDLTTRAGTKRQVAKIHFRFML